MSFPAGPSHSRSTSCTPLELVSSPVVVELAEVELPLPLLPLLPLLVPLRVVLASSVVVPSGPCVDVGATEVASPVEESAEVLSSAQPLVAIEAASSASRVAWWAEKYGRVFVGIMNRSLVIPGVRQPSTTPGATTVFSRRPSTTGRHHLRNPSGYPPRSPLALRRRQDQIEPDLH